MTEQSCLSVAVRLTPDKSIACAMIAHLNKCWCVGACAGGITCPSLAGDDVI